MPHSNKPKVPPIQPHRSVGDAGVPQRGDSPDAATDADAAEHAPESGEPAEANRSHGRVIDDNGGPAGGDADDKANEDENWESGRHKSG